MKLQEQQYQVKLLYRSTMLQVFLRRIKGDECRGFVIQDGMMREVQPHEAEAIAATQPDNGSATDWISYPS